MLVTLLVGALASGLAGHRQLKANEAYIESRFETISRGLADAVQDRLQLYEYGLRGARGVLQLAGEEGISDDAFQRYMRTRDMPREFPGSRGFGFIRRLPATVPVGVPRADGHAPIRQLAPHNGERFVIERIEPLSMNREALGLDVASETTRREAAVAAMQRNRAVMTAPITLVQAENARQRAFLVLLPLYRDGPVPLDAEQREAAAYGWAYTPLVIDEVLAGLSLHSEHIALTLTDITDPQDPQAFFDTTDRGAAVAHNAMSDSLLRTPFGRSWAVRTEARPSFASQFSLLAPQTVAWTGCLVTLLLAALQWAWLALRQRRLQAQTLQARLATIIENASDAIVGQDVDGRVMLWNQAAERLFGWSADEAMGDRASELLLPPERQDEARQLASRVLAGSRIPRQDTQLRHREGQMMAVAITASAISDHKGRAVGMALVIRDIRDRKAYEEQLLQLNAELECRVQQRTESLEEVERFLRTVLDAVPSKIGYWDRHQINRAANRAYLAWRAPQGGTLIGRTIHEAVGHAVYERFKLRIDAVLRGEPQHFDATLDEPGTGRPREMRLSYLPDVQNGEVRGFYTIVDDVSELNRTQRQLEAAARQQAAERVRLQSILQGTNAGTWEWNVQTGEVVFNERWAAMLGFDYDEWRPMGVQVWHERTHADDFQRSSLRLQRHFDGEDDFYECELRLRHADGHWVWALDRGQVCTYTPDGRPEWMFGTTLDISAIKATEERLRDSESFLDRVSQVAGVGGWQFEVASGRFTWTRQTRRICEAPAWFKDDVTGALSFYAPEARPVLQAAFDRALSEGVPFDIASPYRTAGGRELWVRTVGVPEYDPTHPIGTPVRLVGAIQDVTDRHLAEQALRDATQKAQAASQAKSAFLANMSHEIRTPLHAVLGVAHLLSDTELNADQRALLGKGQAAGRALLGIVNDVLDLAKIEAGEMHLAREPFALGALLQELVAVYAVPARDKGVTLSLDGLDGLPEAMLGDAARLRQVLANLVGNALKFTERGEIRVQVSVSEVDGSQRIRLSVHDSGIGIAPDVQSRLFQPFTQADDTTTRRFGGTGLGLSIVKHLVGLMGGCVGLRSTEGQGSEFWIELPLARAQLADAAQAPSAPVVRRLQGVRVLLVDDSEINREIAGRMLTQVGAQVRTCADGAQALAQLQAAPQAFDIVLMDVQMPVMDGLEATRHIRADATLRELPVIALTAGALADERQRALDAGFTAFLPKPLEPRDLLATMGRLVGVGADDDRAMASSTTSPDSTWPALPGVDTRRASVRLGNDLALFRKLLGRLLDERGDWSREVPATAGHWTDQARAEWRARAHRLKGSASMLGAQPVASVAARLEVLLQTPGVDNQAAAAMLGELHAAFAGIDEGARAWLNDASAHAADEDGLALDADAQADAESRLLIELGEQDLSAIDTFGACRPGLVQRLGRETVAAVSTALDTLDFARALQLLIEANAESTSEATP
ncbi:MAG: PAS domain S-box protein [Hydrogenophaga sp.]|nr:PAS domain S-box protein [Hydrogenophaga sp.]